MSDAQKAFYRDLGYTGSLQDMERAYYNTGAMGVRELTASELAALTSGVIGVTYEVTDLPGRPRYRWDGAQFRPTFVGNTVTPKTNDSDGIDAAIAAIVASGKPGTVALLPEDYAITRDHALVSNVGVIGVPPKLVFSGDIPDAEFSCSGGTRFLLSPGVVGFKWNNVDKGSEETNIAENALSGVLLRGMTFIGGAKAIDIGALRAMGPVFCEFDELYGFDQTSDFAFDFKNFQHCKFGRIYTSTQLTAGSGVRFASQLTNTLLPGNSQFTDEIYTYCKNRLNRSIVFEASGPSGCILNQIKVTGRLQGNRYGAGVPDAISATATNGSADLAVPDGTNFAVGVPVVFHSTAPTNFTVDVVYFVKSISGNTIQLIENTYDAVAVSSGSSGAHTLSLSGFPSIEIKASSGNAIKNSDFGQIDAEAYGNVAAMVIAKTRNCRMFLSEIMTSSTNTALVTRDAEIAIDYAGLTGVTQDLSANFGFSCARNGAGGPYVYSGGSFTLDSAWNGRDVRYTGTGDITITVPNYLPKGFRMSITPTGATGVVTFAAASGGAVFSKSGLRTSGQYATGRLENIANKVYRLTGDLQV